MGLRTFGGGSAEVAVDLAGNATGGITFTVWDSPAGGSQVTDLQDLDGSPLPGTVVSDPDPADPKDLGRIYFKAPDAYSFLYLDRGYGQRWAIMAREIGSLVGTAIARSNAAYDAVQELKKGAGVTFAVAGYGAKGDGITDDTSAIRAAVNDAIAAGGGIVWFEPRTYRCADLILIGSHVTLEGNGAVILKGVQPGEASFRAFAVKSNGATGYGSGAVGVRWRNLTIRGNFAAGRGGQAMNANHLSDFIAEGCRFEQLGSTSHVFDLGGCEDITLRDSVFAGCLQVDNNEAVQLDCSTLGGMVIDDPAGYDGLPTRRVLLDNCQSEPVTVAGVTYPAPHLIGSHYAPPVGTYYTDITVRGGSTTDPLLDAASVPARGSVHFVGVAGMRVDGHSWHLSDPAKAPVLLGVYSRPADGGGTSRPRDIILRDLSMNGSSVDQSQLVLTGCDNVNIDSVHGSSVGAGSNAAIALTDVNGFRVLADLTAGSGTHAAGVSIGAGCTNGYADVRASGFTNPTVVTTGLTAVTVPDQAPHVIGDPGEPVFQNSWAGFSGQDITYEKLPSGKVSVSGAVAGGDRATTVFTLPVGYRPPATKNLPVLIKADAGISGKLTVGSSGNFAFAADDFNGTGTIVWASVDVEFWPAP